jgi:hypothetical protein
LHQLLPLLIKQTPPNSFHIDPLSSSITTPPRDRLTVTSLSLSLSQKVHRQWTNQPVNSLIPWTLKETKTC